jgi:sugar lactone lactonase YvrE
VPSDLGAAAPWGDGFIAGTQEGIGLLSRNGKLSLLANSPPLSAAFRFNDGKLDPAGRFWCGTTTYDFTPQAGALYRVEQNGEMACVLDGLTLANGLDWDVKARRFYFIDTMTQRVDVFDYDVVSGQIANRRVAFEIPKALGIPDGMACDCDGRVWVACWGGGHVVGFEPNTGAVIGRIRVPTQLTSSCWVGPDHGTMYITTARLNLSAETLAKEPLAGSVFQAPLAGFSQ